MMSSPMGGKQSPFGNGSPPQHTTSHYSGGAPKYINDFTKALAGEVRILLEEVGKLRDERRALQQEIGELMALKSKHGTGGEYSAGWSAPPQIEAPPPPPAIEPPPEPTQPAEAKPGWRTVHQKKERKPRAAITAPPPVTPMVAPVPIIPPDPPATKMPSWAQWRPSPNFMAPPPPPPLQPSMPPTPMAPPPRAGLFGPSTPPPS